ncbi:unnamed protein product [Rotaria socialis]|uniref:BioF2-like acetyltransferase domain-containing protein n=2 Tax=Rotaria socialis TaxID=392032 RepID=A0A818F321_9BILA|nr:unnamed protein product [Rotaria socialis]
MAPNQENLEGPYSPDIDLSFKRVVQRELKKLIVVNVINLIACSTTIILYIYFNVSFRRHKYAHDKTGQFVFELILLIFGILNTIFGLSLAIYERVQGQQQQQPKDKMISFQRCNYIHLLLNLICFIAFAIYLIIEFIYWFSALQVDTNLRSSIQLVIIILLLLIVLCCALCVIWNRILAWTPKYRFSRAILFFSSMILVAISIVTLILNHRVHFFYPVIAPDSHVPLACYSICQASASYTVIWGIFGTILTFIYAKAIRLNKLRNGIWYVFNATCLIGIMIVVASTIILLLYNTTLYGKINSSNVKTLINADTALSVLRCIILMLMVTSLHCLRKVSRSDKNGLTVESIQLSKQSPAYIKHWGTAIDACSQTLDGMTGDAALQLMMAYQEGQLDDVTGIVLRIARPARRIQILIDQWDDTEAIVFLTLISHYDTTVSALPKSSWGGILQRTLGSQNCMPCFRPLALRLGLLGFHWPFRAGIFFTSCHADAASRAVHVLESVLEWNGMQNSKLHCDVLLLPTLSTEPMARAINSAGFFPLPLPPTHMLDLRSHHGKTLEEYMKSLKKSRRRPYLQQFLKKGGIVEVIHDLSRLEVGAIVCDQWENIARARQEKNEPPTLARPSAQFITAIGHTMIESYRSVILLRFNNEVIASSVIFKFPNKLFTTDIQGLTHEKARPLKAYFVMLQWVIKEALNEKFDFVEFGPTTPGPKMDLSCTQVPLQAAGYCGNPIIAFGIKKCGAMVDTVHMKTENQNPNTFEEVTFEEENVEVQVNSLKTKTPGSVASVLVRQVPPTGSYVTQTQHSSENNPSAAVISQLTNVSRSIHDNSANAEVLKDAIEISKKQVLRLSEKQKPANDRKTPRFSNTDRSDQYPCNKHNFTKTKNSTPRTNQENNLSTGSEAVFDELESHNPVNPIQTLSMSSNSNADEATLSLSRPKNLK